VFLSRGALLLGTTRLFGRNRDPLVSIYVVASALTALIAIQSPATESFLKLLGAQYVTRFAYIFPLPALAGLGLALATSGRERVRSVVFATGLVAISLYVAVLFRGVEPWNQPFTAHPPPQTRRPELESLEPIIRDRVVVAKRQTAYVLPYFTGAFVAWNGYESHGNRWVYDHRRRVGAKKILHGGMSDLPLQRYCDRYAVDFVLLPSAHRKEQEHLLATQQFRTRVAGKEHVLLERTPAR
jgi:hypothetical protein